MNYILLILVLTVIDQITKYRIDRWLLEGQTYPILTNFFHLTYVKNRGIAFGLFQGRLDIISTLTLIVVIYLSFYFYKNRAKLSTLEKIAYSFILGGAFGNIIDRFYRGFVIDMLDFRGIWHYIFNLADVWINIGVILIIIQNIMIEVNRKKQKEEEMR